MNDKKNLAILTIIFIIFSIIFWGKIGNPLIDFSRESYIPFQLNNNEKLIKDIFLIYGPFGYFLNAFFYKFSTNLNILFLEANLISYSILFLFYFILKKFCEEKIALIFSIIFISISIFSDTTFNFIMPYSYSTLWAYFGIYLALFCLLYNKKNILFLSLGLILANRIEFFIPVFIISIIYLINKKENFAKNIAFILIFPILSYGALFLNNIDINSILQNYKYIIKMTKTSSISSLYEGVGSFFEIHYFKYNLICTLKFATICLLSYFAFLKNNKIISYIILFIGFIFLHLEFALNLSGIILILLTIYSIIKKTISKEELLLILFSIFLCSKSFFAINSLSYSNYGFILLIFAVYLNLRNIDKKWLSNLFIIFFSLLFISKMIFFYYESKTKVITPVGNFWLNIQKADLMNETNDFIEKNIDKNKNFIVIPEGQILNLIHKKEHKFLNSTFTPLDFETFGEKKLIDKLKESKIEYIINFPRDTKDYGAKTMCYDYAVDFCKYVIDNYTEVKSFGEFEKVHIYKIKSKK